MWLMRQAGRYMAAFREYSDRIGFRYGAAHVGGQRLGEVDPDAPCHAARGGIAPDERRNLVPVGGEQLRKRAADEAARSRDHQPHR